MKMSNIVTVRRDERTISPNRWLRIDKNGRLSWGMGTPAIESIVNNPISGIPLPLTLQGGIETLSRLQKDLEWAKDILKKTNPGRYPFLDDFLVNYDATEYEKTVDISGEVVFTITLPKPVTRSTFLDRQLRYSRDRDKPKAKLETTSVFRVLSSVDSKGKVLSSSKKRINEQVTKIVLTYPRVI